MNKIKLFFWLVPILSGLGCSSNQPLSSRPTGPVRENQPTEEARNEVNKRIEYYKQEIRKNLPFKTVLWEAVTSGATRLTLLNDFLYVETGHPRLYAIRTDTGFCEWQLHLEHPLDFPPCVVDGIPEEIIRLKTEIDKKLQEIMDETTKKGRDEDRIRRMKQERDSLRESFKASRQYDTLYFIARGMLYCVDRFRKDILWREQLDFVPATRPSATLTSVFIGALDKPRVYQFDVGRRYAKYWFRSGDTVTSPPLYHDPMVYFTSDDGRVYCYDSLGGDKKWDFPTEKAIKTEPMVDGDTLYVGSTDFAFYAINRHTGTLEWKFETGNPIISKSAFQRTKIVKDNKTTFERTVYFRPQNDGLHSLQIKDVEGLDAQGMKILLPRPELKWNFKNGKSFLMSGLERTYVVGQDNQTLYALNPDNGEVKNQYSLELFPFRVVDQNARILYLGTKDGYIFAVQESRSEF
ncbi:MAG: PQQ-binding-like beta-propeller repeat protein [Planctomycetota bacterium]|mgnify:CR=1 FL=1